MSSHDWPEFGLHPNPCYTENGNGDRYAIRLSSEAYNYAKVRIDACAGMVDPQLTIKTLLDNLVAADENIEELEAERDALQQRCEELVAALEKLARLGNGDQYGNSIGNEIARQALAAQQEAI